MAEVSAPPAQIKMEDVIAAPVPLDAAAAPTAVPVVSPPAGIETKPEIASETLYIQNLNEKIRPHIMKQTLRGLFKNYGEVLDVVAHSNLRMRGQAFVSFADIEIAKKACKEVKGFPLYSKPMQVSFARTRSDVVVQRLDADHLEEHKSQRKEHKKATRYKNPLKQKFKAKRVASEIDGGAVQPPSKRPNVQMPDEYLPPNKILFLQNLPETVTKEQLTALFAQYPNLYEVRLVPTKKDIAFVEYTDEASSGVAKDALHNYKIDGEHKIKITFARK